MEETQTAQEIIDTCDEKLTDEEVKDVESKANKEIEEEVKETVKKIKQK